MVRTLRFLRWPLFLAYAVAGAMALMLATPAGAGLLGQDMLSFIPARVTGLPWSLATLTVHKDPVLTLALLGICYGLNFGVGLMLAREGGE